MGASGMEELLFVEYGNACHRFLVAASSTRTLIGGQGPCLEVVNGTSMWTFCIRDVF